MRPHPRLLAIATLLTLALVCCVQAQTASDGGPTGSIDVLVLDPDGNLITNPAEVDAYAFAPDAGDVGRWDDAAKVGDVVEGDPGRRRISGLAPGAHVLRIDVCRHGDPPVETLLVRAGETVTRTARAWRGGSIRGRVTDETGAPLQGIVVTEVGCELRCYRSGTSDASGGFEISGFNETPTALVVGCDDPARRRLGRCDTLVQGMTIALEPAARARGVVVDLETGKPIEGAQVAPYWIDRVGRDDMVTDAAGRFALDDLRPGEVMLRVFAIDHGTTTVVFTAAPLAVTEVAIALGRPSTVEGVVAGPDGVPVEGAVVAFDDGARHVARDAIMEHVSRPSHVSPSATYLVQEGEAVVSDVAGRFRIERASRGARRLVASAPGFLPGEARIDIPSGGTATARLVLGRGGVVECAVVEPGSGSPIWGSGVTLRRADGVGDGGSTATRTADGAVRYAGLEAGAYVLEVRGAWSGGIFRCTRAISVGLDQALRVTIEPRPSTAFEARVRFAPLDAAYGIDQAWLEDAATGAREPSCGTREESPGSSIYRLSGVAGRRYDIGLSIAHAGGGGHGSVIEELVFPAVWRLEGATLVADVVMEVGSIEGRVLLAGGAPPPPGMRVAACVPREGAESRRSPIGLTSTADDGTFALEVVGDGPFDVWAEPEASTGVGAIGIIGGPAVPESMLAPAVATGVRPGAVLALVVREGVPFHVRLRDPGGGTPRGASGFAVTAGGARFDGMGRDSLTWHPLPAGEVDVFAASPSSGLLRVRAVTVSAATAFHTLALPPPSALEVEVRRAASATPIEGARLDVLWADDRAPVPFIPHAAPSIRATDVGGLARRQGLAPGQYLARVTSPEGRVVETPILLRARETTRLVVEVP